MCLTEYDEEVCIRTWREDGLAEDAHDAKLETARNMLAEGIPLATVLKCTGLTEEDLKEAVAQIN